MTSKDFVSLLRGSVIEENIAIYKNLFSGTRIEDASDPYWKEALSLFDSLSPKQRDIFFLVLRQVAIDSTSNILGVIDGVISPNGTNADFHLTYGANPAPLNGDLQSLFLAEIERV